MAGRRMSSRLGSLVIVLALVAPRPADAALSVFAVNSTADAVDAKPGDGKCATAAATCTLRAAVQEASLLANDVLIGVPAGFYRLTLANPTGLGCPSGKTGALEITNYHPRTITIVGGVSSTIIDGNQLDGVFSVNTGPGATTNIQQLTIRGGNRLAAGTCHRFGGALWASA